MKYCFLEVIQGAIPHDRPHVHLLAVDLHSVEDVASLRVHVSNAAVVAASGEGLALWGRVCHRPNAAAVEVQEPPFA